jgi:hypothetical protein
MFPAWVEFGEKQPRVGLPVILNPKSPPVIFSPAAGVKAGLVPGGSLEN